MKSIIIQAPEDLFEAFSAQDLEKLLNEMLDRVATKIAANSMLKDLKEMDFMDDPKWKAAREAAWEQEKKHFFKKVNKHLDGVYS